MGIKWNHFNNARHINLRQELGDLFKVSNGFGPIGQWVILRRYDSTKLSKHYQPVTKEGIEGSKYEYKDELCLTYKWNLWIGDPFSETETAAGVMNIPFVTFFFEYTIKPKEIDEIYEFEWEDNTVKPELSQIPKPYTTRYNIKNVLNYRLDNGRIEFYACRCIKENIKY